MRAWAKNIYLKLAPNGLQPYDSRVASKKINKATLLREGTVIGSKPTDLKTKIMIKDLEQIANEIANSRVRLSNPLMDKQTRQDIIDEAKRMEYIEGNLRRTISDLKDKLDELRGE